MRIYAERMKHAESNPIVKISRYLSNALTNDIEAYELLSALSDTLSLPDFLYYLLFEAVAQYLRDQQSSEGLPLHHYLAQLPDNDFLIGADPENTYKRLSEDLQLRKEFITAERIRNKIPYDIEQSAWLQKMNVRSNLRDGYKLTPFQFEQLREKHILGIHKKLAFRQFKNSKHSTNSEIIDYYYTLKSHAATIQQETNIQLRLIRAINLNDLESRNAYLFLLQAARCCYNLGITELDDSVIEYLRLLCGNYNYNNGELYIAHNPVLISQNFIMPALQGDFSQIDCYIELLVYAHYYRTVFLPPLLRASAFSCNDVWEFFFSENSILSGKTIFNLYANVYPIDNASHVLPILRKLIDKLTIDPLATSY